MSGGGRVDRRAAARKGRSCRHRSILLPHSFKFIAALQANQAGSAPVLARIETRTGHGAGKPTQKRIDEVADVYAFLVWVLGLSLPQGFGARPAAGGGGCGGGGRAVSAAPPRGPSRRMRSPRPPEAPPGTDPARPKIRQRDQNLI